MSAPGRPPLAVRLAKPQSQVVREAPQEYEARGSKLADAEQQRMLDTFAQLSPQTYPEWE